MRTESSAYGETAASFDKKCRANRFAAISAATW